MELKPEDIKLIKLVFLNIVLYGILWLLVRISESGQFYWIGIIGFFIYLALIFYNRIKVVSTWKEIKVEWTKNKNNEYYKILDVDKKLYTVKRKELSEKLLNFSMYVIFPVPSLLFFLLVNVMNGPISLIFSLLFIPVVIAWLVRVFHKFPTLVYFSPPIISVVIYFSWIINFFVERSIVFQSLVFLAINAIIYVIFIFLFPVPILRKINRITVLVTFSFSLLGMISSPLISEWISAYIMSIDVREQNILDIEDDFDGITDIFSSFRYYLYLSGLDEERMELSNQLLDIIEYVVDENFDEISNTLSWFIEREFWILELMWNEYMNSESSQVQSIISLAINSFSLAYTTGIILIGWKISSKKENSKKKFRDLLLNPSNFEYLDLITSAFDGGDEYENLMLNNEMLKTIILENEKNLEIPEFSIKEMFLEKLKTSPIGSTLNDIVDVVSEIAVTVNDNDKKIEKEHLEETIFTDSHNYEEEK